MVILVITNRFSQAALLLSKLSPELVGEPLDARRLYDAVNVLLSLQVIRVLSDYGECTCSNNKGYM